MMSTQLLRVDDLVTEIRGRRRTVRPVDGVSLTVAEGETVGLVGESGSGKTMTAMSVMRLLPSGGHIAGGTIELEGRDLGPLTDKQIRRVRGNEVAMVFQDPMTSLNPTMTIGQQIVNPLRVHREISRRAARERAQEMLDLVGLPRPAERLDDFPHQLSGGMRQRVMIAMALSCEPKLLIADEPTTALDVTIQAQILALLDRLKTELKMGVLLVTHDMGVIAGHTDRVLVMYAGRIVESARTAELFARPRHRYTEALLRAIPRLDTDRNSELFSIPGAPPDLAAPPAGCRFAPRCTHADEQCRSAPPPLDGDDPGHPFACVHPRDHTIAATVSAPVLRESRVAQNGRDADPDERAPVLELADVVKEFPVTGGALQRRAGSVSAVAGVTFSVMPGETFGLVGESGCGKTTIGRMVVGLEQASGGAITLDGHNLHKVSRSELKQLRRSAHLMFQDPYASLDPRMSVGASVREALRIHRVGSRPSRRERVGELLDSVGLTAAAAERYPHEFSGGQRQRIGFARALALNPRLIVADEPVSALDVSIQSQILNLMKDVQREFGLAYVVISHDLSVVRYLSDRIGVMYLGKLVEIGPAERVYRAPIHPYTSGLLSAIPVPDPAKEKQKGKEDTVAGELPSALHPPSGCRFRTRCPRAIDRCATEEPPLRKFGDGHFGACHLPLREPVAPSVPAALPQAQP
jgi:oligopeptide/dipeptide ABC transporter ATP-binding protein